MRGNFNKRAFISLVTFFLSIAIVVSGLMLLILPDATLAYWNKWSFFGLEKGGWEQFHAVISIYITIIVVLHIMENWKAMMSYMKSKKGEGFKSKKELILASLLSFVLISGSVVESPVTSVVKVFEPIQEAWYSEKDEPPFEDAQGLSLRLLIKIGVFTEEEVVETFEKHNIAYNSLDDILEDIADENSISSKNILNLIKRERVE